MLLNVYAKTLLALNRHKLKDSSNKKLFASLTHGLVEELLELQVAIDDKEATDKIIKEVGDVYAYAVLIALSVEFLNPLHIRDNNRMWEENISDYVAQFFQPVPNPKSLVKLALFHAGSFKRHNREDADIDLFVVADAATSAYLITKDFLKNRGTKRAYDLDLGTVLLTNIEKLQGRASRGTMFAGSGER